MSTVTAHVLIGMTHSLHGGISPTHTIYLHENSRPVLTLLQQDLLPRGRQTTQPVVWIPSLDHMLDDLMLMTHLFVIRDPELRLAATPTLLQSSTEPISMLEVNKEHALDQLYVINRRIHTRFKMQWVVSRESTLYRQLSTLDQYDADVEIYTPTYIREFSAWDGQTHVHGEIPIES